MRLLNWTLLLAAGGLPALAYAGGGEFERPDAAVPDPVQIQVLPAPDSGYVRHLYRVEEKQTPDNTYAPLRQLQRARQQASGGPGAQMKMEKGAWLGVGASQAPVVLGKQLGLPRGTGLVVDVVVPKSPADEAGLKQYDVLRKLDDQLLVNAEQLAVLVRTYKPGTPIDLTVIRDGKEITLNPKLVEHEIEPLPDEGTRTDPFGNWANPYFVSPPQLGSPPSGATPLSPVPNRPYIQRWNPPAGGAQKTLPQGLQWQGLGPVAGTLTLISGDRACTLTMDREGHKTVTVKDAAGKTIFEGPVDTKEQRTNAPADVRTQLDMMRKLAPSAFAAPKLKTSEDKDKAKAQRRSDPAKSDADDADEK
ncbi:MAG TPA: PDZ domain-containing protein [Tepidisphaeraceae bacterium]|nr:PDZ domain-containing protein [Tepidisphaeraceae bacterium]